MTLRPSMEVVRKYKRDVNSVRTGAGVCLIPAPRTGPAALPGSSPPHKITWDTQQLAGGHFLSTLA